MTTAKSKNIKKYFAVFALSMVSSSLYLLPYIKYVFNEALMAGLNATNEMTGYLLTVYAIVCALGYIPGGWVADRFSAKKIIIVSAIATGILNIVLAFVMDYTTALIIWGLLGFSTSFAYWGASIKAIRLLGDSSEQGRLYGFFQSFEGLMNTVSAFGALAIFALFSTQVLGLKYTLIFYGVMCFISAILLHVTYEESANVDDNEEEKIKLADIGKVIKLPQTWILAFIIFSIYAVYSGSTLLTQYVTDVIGIAGTAGGVIAIFRTYVARFVFCPVGGFIADKTKQTSKTILAIAIVTVILIAGFFLVGPQTNLLFVLVLIMVSAALIYMNYGIMWAVAEEVKIPRYLYGTAVGVASIIGYLPDSFMHTIFGRWIDEHGNKGYDYIFTSLVILCVITIVFAILAIRKKKTAEKAALVEEKTA